MWHVYFCCGDFFEPVLHFEHFEFGLDYQNLPTPTPTHGFIYSIFMAFSQYFELCLQTIEFRGGTQMHLKSIHLTIWHSQVLPDTSQICPITIFVTFFWAWVSNPKSENRGFHISVVDSIGKGRGGRVVNVGDQRLTWTCASPPPGPSLNTFKVIPDNVPLL